MDDAPRNLVSVQQLAAGLSKGWIPVDCRFDLTDPSAGLAAYSGGHIPGARYADLDTVLSAKPGPQQGRHPLPDPDGLVRWLSQQGVSPDTQVVAYDADSGAFAARLWWLMRWIGHGRVAVLDGGLAAWEREGLSLSQDVPTVTATEYSLSSLRDAWVVETESLLSEVAQGGVLIDARAVERYTGEVEPLDPVGGHVPGAVNYPFQRNLDSSLRFRSTTEIRALLEDFLGGAPADQVIAMCGSGVTACHLLLALEEAGLGGGRLYAGSWSEWVRDPAREVAIGGR